MRVLIGWATMLFILFRPFLDGLFMLTSHVWGYPMSCRRIMCLSAISAFSAFICSELHWLSKSSNKFQIFYWMEQWMARNRIIINSHSMVVLPNFLLHKSNRTICKTLGKICSMRPDGKPVLTYSDTSGRSRRPRASKDQQFGNSSDSNLQHSSQNPICVKDLGWKICNAEKNLIRPIRRNLIIL